MLKYIKVYNQALISTLLPEQKMHELDLAWNILPKRCPKNSGKVRGKKIGSPWYPLKLRVIDFSAGEIKDF